MEFAALLDDPAEHLPEGWSAICDSATRVSFVGSEKWELNGRRLCVELTVELDTSGDHKFVIKSHGSKINADNLAVGAYLHTANCRPNSLCVIAIEMIKIGPIFKAS